VRVIEDFWLNALFSVTPTILIGGIFWYAMRAVLRADRGERDAYARIEAQERARLDEQAG
jgi:hypothetical protein